MRVVPLKWLLPNIVEVPINRDALLLSGLRLNPFLSITRTIYYTVWGMSMAVVKLLKKRGVSPSNPQPELSESHTDSQVIRSLFLNTYCLVGISYTLKLSPCRLTS